MRTPLWVLSVLLAFAHGSVSWAVNAPVTCAIQTYNGHFLSAIDGGGHATDPLVTSATSINTWEKFTLVDQGFGSPVVYGIQTYDGHYLTANNGGGLISNVMRSNATQVLGWEQFRLIPVGNGYYAIQTLNGNYLTATGGGGHYFDTDPNPIHSDATSINTWEMFRFICGIAR